MISLKRVYEAPSRDDGFRVLVERLWPRGISKQAARVGLWLKDVAPSPELRTWYNHDVQKWPEFKRRYKSELRSNDAVAQLRSVLRGKREVTFVYAARDEEHNSALVLKSFMEKSPQSERPRRPSPARSGGRT